VTEPEEPCLDSVPDKRSNDLTVVTLVLQQMTLLEARLIKRLDDNAKALSGKWDHHEAEHADLINRLSKHETLLLEHLREEEDQQLQFDARVKPVMSLAAIIKREWRTIVIIGLLLLDGAEQVRHSLGG
jgi:hypothetical protein